MLFFQTCHPVLKFCVLPTVSTAEKQQLPLDKYYMLWFNKLPAPYIDDGVLENCSLMNCPYCGYHNSRVTDSREVNEGIRRRRQCLGCKARFTTYEHIQPVSLFVIKKDHRRELFDRQKLLSGLRKACEKRPLPVEKVERLANEIEAELYGLGRAEIPSAMIGDTVMKRLKGLDHIAYIRFASVYRDFTDITALKRELDTLMVGEGDTVPPSAQLPLLPDEKTSVAARRPKGSRR